MLMANITVSYGELEHAASRLGAGRDEITQCFQSLQAQIAGLVASGFVTDQASGRFHESFTEYTTSARSVVEKLTEMQRFLTQTADAMRDMDAQIAARIA